MSHNSKHGDRFLIKLGLLTLEKGHKLPWVKEHIKSYEPEIINHSKLIFGWNEILGSFKTFCTELYTYYSLLTAKGKKYPLNLFEARFIPNGIKLTEDNRIRWPATLAELAYLFGRLSSNALRHIKGESIIPVDDRLHLRLAANFVNKDGEPLDPHVIAASLNRYRNFIDEEEGIFKPQPRQSDCDYQSIARKLQQIEYIISAVKNRK